MIMRSFIHGIGRLTSQVMEHSVSQASKRSVKATQAFLNKVPADTFAKVRAQAGQAGASQGSKQAFGKYVDYVTGIYQKEGVSGAIKVIKRDLALLGQSIYRYLDEAVRSALGQAPVKQAKTATTKHSATKAPASGTAKAKTATKSQAAKQPASQQAAEVNVEKPVVKKPSSNQQG